GFGRSNPRGEEPGRPPGLRSQLPRLTPCAHSPRDRPWRVLSAGVAFRSPSFVTRLRLRQRSLCRGTGQEGNKALGRHEGSVPHPMPGPGVGREIPRFGKYRHSGRIITLHSASSSAAILGGWDWLHEARAVPTRVALWFPPLCAAFDFVVAVLVL